MTTTMNLNFRIVASMSDYHSSRHASFNTCPLLRKVGSQEYRLWIDGFGSKEEARKELEKWAMEQGSYYDEASIAEEVNGLNEADEELDYTAEEWKADNRWYDGPGWYDEGHEKIYEMGSDIYRSDIWTWEIEEA